MCIYDPETGKQQFFDSTRHPIAGPYFPIYFSEFYIFPFAGHIHVPGGSGSHSSLPVSTPLSSAIIPAASPVAIAGSSSHSAAPIGTNVTGTPANNATTPVAAAGTAAGPKIKMKYYDVLFNLFSFYYQK